MGKSKAPAPPDPVTTANAQTTSNIQTAEANARLNRINEYNPYYNVLYDRTPPSQGGNMQTQPVSMTPVAAPAQPQGQTQAEIDRMRVILHPADFEDWMGRNAARQSAGQPSNLTGATVPGSARAAPALGYGDGVPEPSTYTRRIELTPQQQAIFDSQRRTDLGLSELAGESVQRVRDTMATPFNYEGIPELMSGGQMDAERRRVEQALFDRLNPQIDRDERALEQRLANQGIAIGSEAWRSAMGDSSRARNDARLAVTGQGLRETQGLFGLGLSRRQQGIQERAYERSYPVNEIATLLGTAGPVQTPQFQGVPQVGVQGTDVSGPIYANYQGALRQAERRQGARNAAMGGLFGLAGTVAGGMFGGPWGAMAGGQAGRMFG